MRAIAFSPTTAAVLALLTVLTTLTAGCDEEKVSRHPDFADNPSTRFSNFRGPYGPYYIRPNQHHSAPSTPDPALAIQAPDLGDDPLRDGVDALTGERSAPRTPRDTTTLDQGFDHTPRKFQPPPQPEATPYSMAQPSPMPGSPRLHPLGPPPAYSTSSGVSDTAAERWMTEERKRRTVLFPHSGSTVFTTPPPASPSPAPTPSAASDASTP